MHQASIVISCKGSSDHTELVRWTRFFSYRTAHCLELHVHILEPHLQHRSSSQLLAKHIYTDL